MDNTHLPCPVTIDGRGVGAFLRGKKGTALTYFRDSEGGPWAVVELRGCELLIIHQSYIREERKDA